MKKIFVLLILILNFMFVSNAKAASITYQTHIQNIGWQNEVVDSEISGTTGRALRLEAIKLKLDSSLNGNIEYRTHISYRGWESTYAKNGEQSGTTGRALRLEAIQIKLSGEVANDYDVYYRTHVQNVGWQKWKKNDEISGTTGKALRLEAIQVKLVNKNSFAELTYSSNVQNTGWQGYVNNGEISGTTGTAKSLLGLKLNLNTNIEGKIEYQTYFSDAWGKIVNSDEISGDNKNKLEAIKISLSGEISTRYDIYYKVHVANIGWMDFVKNGTVTGTKGYYRGIEAIQVKLVEKDSDELKVGSKYYYESNNALTYSSHVQNVGWQAYVKNGELSGTTGKSYRIEAIKLNLDTKIGGIQYRINPFKYGFQAYTSNNAISGTTGQSRNLEAIQIRLTGEIANVYDIYYRTHISNIGWLGWAKNDEVAGSVGNGTKIEAYQIKLVKKGASAPGGTNNHYVTGTWKNNNKNYYNYFGTKLTGWQWIDGSRYYFNSYGTLQGAKVKKIMDVSSWQTVNWNTVKSTGDIDGAILRVGWGMSYDDAAGIDTQFDHNIKEVQRLGIPYSIYIYAYARVTSAAEKEATFVKDMMQKYNIPKSTFVWYDAEEKSRGLAVYNTVIPAFVNKMKSFGYNNIGVYGNLNALVSSGGYLNSPTIKSYPIWVAQYNSDCDYSGSYRGWQYTSSGAVSGVSSSSGRVDLNMFY